jgi:hypothetical protein
MIHAKRSWAVSTPKERERDITGIVYLAVALLGMDSKSLLDTGSKAVDSVLDNLARRIIPDYKAPKRKGLVCE